MLPSLPNPCTLAEMPIRLPALRALWPKPFTVWLASSNRLYGSVMQNGMGAGRQKAYNAGPSRKTIKMTWR
jgi:hypothetical protein